MKYFTRTFVAALVLLSSQHVFSRAIDLPLSQKVRESNLIARVRILSTAKNAVKGQYKSIAKVKILRSIKGASNGATAELEFDNGYKCPNVLYTKGEDVLIFASRLENGHYHTYNTYFGKFEIQKNKIAWWGKSGKSGTSWNDVMTQIRALLPKAK